MSTIMSRMMGSSSTTSTLRIAAFSLMLFSLFYRRLYTWKVEAKDGPFAGYADLQPEFAAHRFDIAAADEQAQTGAAYRRSQGARGAHEFLEDLPGLPVECLRPRRARAPARRAYFRYARPCYNQPGLREAAKG